jgi:RNA polymerase sigma-70 factor (ECF subfamily)
MPAPESFGAVNEGELEAAAAAGDTAALGQLLDTHRQSLARQVARKLPADLRGVVAADDVVQEACVEALRAVRQRAFRPDGPASFRRWLWKIATHRLYDLIKAHRRHKRAGGVPHDANESDKQPVANSEQPTQPAVRHEAAAALRNAVALLSPDSGLAIEMHYLQGLSVSEVACRLGRSEGAVLMLCNRAIKQLRRLLAGLFSACMTPLLYGWLDGIA